MKGGVTKIYRLFFVWMFELQAITSLIVIYLLSLLACYAAVKAQCRGVCNMNFYTFNASEICITNDVCQSTNKNLLQANIQFPPKSLKTHEEVHKVDEAASLRTESASLSQNVGKQKTLLGIDKCPYPSQEGNKEISWNTG